MRLCNAVMINNEIIIILYHILCSAAIHIQFPYYILKEIIYTGTCKLKLIFIFMYNIRLTIVFGQN